MFNSKTESIDEKRTTRHCDEKILTVRESNSLMTHSAKDKGSDAQFDALNRAGRIHGVACSRLAIDGFVIGMEDAVLRSSLGILHAVKAGDEQRNCDQSSRGGDQGCHVVDAGDASGCMLVRVVDGRSLRWLISRRILGDRCGRDR